VGLAIALVASSRPKTPETTRTVVESVAGRGGLMLAGKNGFAVSATPGTTFAER
jgi:hypothetical protein